MSRKFGRCEGCGEKGARYRTVPARYLCTPCFLDGPSQSPRARWCRRRPCRNPQAPSSIESSRYPTSCGTCLTNRERGLELDFTVYRAPTSRPTSCCRTRCVTQLKSSASQG